MTLAQVDGALDAVGEIERERLANLLTLITQGARGSERSLKSLAKELR